MKIGVIVNLLNVILNFLFIHPAREINIAGKSILVYGTGWGVLGAAMASAIAFCVGGVLITVVLFRHPVISPKGQSFKPQWDILQPCLKVAIPNIVEGFMQGVGKTKTPFVYNIIGMWGIRIVGTFICTQWLGMGLVSAWACMILHNLLLFTMFLVSYIKGTWNPLHS